MPIIEILIISICSFWFAELSTIPQLFIKWAEYKRLRPFDCSKCLGFWVGCAYVIINNNPFSLLYIPILTSFFAIIFSRLYYKFLS